jgi:hypothetical protein
MNDTEIEIKSDSSGNYRSSWQFQVLIYSNEQVNSQKIQGFKESLTIQIPFEHTAAN